MLKLIQPKAEVVSKGIAEVIVKDFYNSPINTKCPRCQYMLRGHFNDIQFLYSVKKLSLFMLRQRCLV